MEATLELLQKVLNTIDVGIVFVDPDNKIVFFNREAGKMMNEEPEKRIGTSILLCHPKKSEQKLVQFIDECRKDPQRRLKFEIVNYQGRMYQETLCSVSDDEGNYLGLVDVIHDAEEKVSLLKQLGKFEEPHISGAEPNVPRRPDASNK